MSATQPIQENIEQKELAVFFDKLIEEISETIRTDQFMIETGVATKETGDIYQAMLNNDVASLVKKIRTSLIETQVRVLLVNYLKELKIRNKIPSRLAMDLSEGKILVWAEIDDSDEEIEDALLMSEAKVNAQFYSQGINISSFIVEKSDNFPIPNHYQEITLTNF